MSSPWPPSQLVCAWSSPVKSRHCPLLACILVDTRSSFYIDPSQMPPICHSRTAISSVSLARLAVESPVSLSLLWLAKAERLSLRRTFKVQALDAPLKLVEGPLIERKMHWVCLEVAQSRCLCLRSPACTARRAYVTCGLRPRVSPFPYPHSL